MNDFSQCRQIIHIVGSFRSCQKFSQPCNETDRDGCAWMPTNDCSLDTCHKYCIGYMPRPIGCGSPGLYDGTVFQSDGIRFRTLWSGSLCELLQEWNMHGKKISLGYLASDGWWEHQRLKGRLVPFSANYTFPDFAKSSWQGSAALQKYQRFRYPNMTRQHFKVTFI